MRTASLGPRRHPQHTQQRHSAGRGMYGFTSLACQPLLLKKRERVWGIVHIRLVPVKEFPNTNQIAERMNVYRKNVMNVLA